MKNVTRLDDRNKYYMHKGYFITKSWPRGMYSTYASNGRLMADTLRGIKKLIDENK